MANFVACVYSVDNLAPLGFMASVGKIKPMIRYRIHKGLKPRSYHTLHAVLFLLRMGYYEYCQKIRKFLFALTLFDFVTMNL